MSFLSYFYSWKNVFVDPESEINFYEWSIGSEAGYDDIMNFTRVESECAENNEIERLDFKEGHAYYISVKVTRNNTCQILQFTTFVWMSLGNL